MTKSEMLELAAALMAAVQRGDIDAVKAIYAEGITLWHTNDRVNQTSADSIRTLVWINKHMKGVRYEELRVAALDDGFVQQHVMRADSPKVDMPSWCTNERVTRIEEYFDSADAVPIIQHIAYVREQQRLRRGEDKPGAAGTAAASDRA
jgi:hypothetical protein